MNFRPAHILTPAGALLFLLIAPLAQAQETSADNAHNPLFMNYDVLEVRIEAPINTLIRERPEEEYLDGKFTYLLPAGGEQVLDLKIRTRGKYRRQKSTCSLPPIRLNFRKGDVEGTEFAGQDKLKLVTHCKSSFDRYEQLVLREYLAYRYLQVMTDKSFGARLLRITYVDTDGKQDTIIKYGFVIEDDEDIADRLNLELAKIPKIEYANIDPKQTNLIAMYEYMIGNTDFSMIRGPKGDDCCHNIVLFRDSNMVYTPIPYDFDFSGMVNAPYAEPNPKFKTRNVRQRVYRGRCSNNEFLPETVAFFQEKEPEFRALIASVAGLASKHSKDLTKYLDSFYEDVSNDKELDKNIIRDCS